MKIPKAEEMNPLFRVCRDCGNWVSLLDSIDDEGKRRNYNVMPAYVGICTCWASDPKKRWNVEANGN